MPVNLNINPVLIAAAVIPAVVLLVLIYRADKREKEPLLLLLSLVLFGIISTGIALAAEHAGDRLLSFFVEKDSIVYNAFYYFSVVAFAEEKSKFLLLKIGTWKSKYFNCSFDGIVYAVFVSLGFALWENIAYVAKYGIDIALLRALTAVPGHACFGVFMGIFYGLAKEYDSRRRKSTAKAYKRLAVVVPMLLHGTYDFIAVTDLPYYDLFFVAFVIIMFVVSLIFVKIASKYDHPIKPNNQLTGK